VVWEGRSREAPPYPDRPEARNRLIATAATVAIEKHPLTVALDRRCHSQVLREAALDRDPVPTPGIGHQSQSVT
jgi:hypothetical protein